MTYQLKNKINDLLSFKLSENNLVYVLKISKSLYLNEKLIETNVQQDSYSFICGKLIYSKENSIYEDGTLLSKKNFLNQQNNSNCNGIIVMGNFEIKNNTVSGDYEYLDLKTGLTSHICNLQNNIFIYLQKVQVHFASKSDITSFSILEFEKKLWQFSLNSLGKYRNFINEEVPYEVMKFIGEHEGILIVQLSNATLLFLNINTGNDEKIIYLNKELPILPGCFYDDGFPPHLVGDKLLWLNNQRYFTINLISYELSPDLSAS